MSTIFVPSFSNARVLFENEYFSDQVDNAFIIDAGDDVSGNVTLQFGNSLAETMSYDTVNTWFILSDDLNLDQNQLIEAVLQNSPSNPSSPVAGQIYHNTSNGGTFIYDGTQWEDITLEGINLGSVQARRTTGFTVGTTFTDMNFDTTDIENNTAVLDHDDVDRDRIQINESGLYRISYDISILGPGSADFVDVGAIVRLNDSSNINGSFSQASAVTVGADTVEGNLSQSFIADLSSGDFISLQVARDASTDVDTVTDAIFTAFRLEGVGTAPTSFPGTDTNTFIIDQDDTGGNLALIFGTALDERLSWENGIGRFELSDDLLLEGDLDVAGINFTLDSENTGAGNTVSIIAEQGTDNNGTLQYNATSNLWQYSNNGGSFAPLSGGFVVSAYDSTGNVAISQTPATLNLNSTHFIDSSAFTLSSSEITIEQDGVYRIDARLSTEAVDNSGAARSKIILQIQENTGSGFIDVPGALCTDYMREQNGQDLSATSCTVTYVQQYDDGDIIRLQHSKEETTTAETVPNGSGVVIEQIRAL